MERKRVNLVVFLVVHRQCRVFRRIETCAVRSILGFGRKILEETDKTFARVRMWTNLVIAMVADNEHLRTQNDLVLLQVLNTTLQYGLKLFARCRDDVCTHNRVGDVSPEFSIRLF